MEAPSHSLPLALFLSLSLSLHGGPGVPIAGKPQLFHVVCGQTSMDAHADTNWTPDTLHNQSLVVSPTFRAPHSIFPTFLFTLHSPAPNSTHEQWTMCLSCSVNLDCSVHVVSAIRPYTAQSPLAEERKFSGISCTKYVHLPEYWTWGLG